MFNQIASARKLFAAVMVHTYIAALDVREQPHWKAWSWASRWPDQIMFCQQCHEKVVISKTNWQNCDAETTFHVHSHRQYLILEADSWLDPWHEHGPTATTWTTPWISPLHKYFLMLLCPPKNCSDRFLQALEGVTNRLTEVLHPTSTSNCKYYTIPTTQIGYLLIRKVKLVVHISYTSKIHLDYTWRDGQNVAQLNQALRMM